MQGYFQVSSRYHLDGRVLLCGSWVSAGYKCAMRVGQLSLNTADVFNLRCTGTVALALVPEFRQYN